jgi:arginine/lysine/histidine transport system ATP-binding protein
MVGIVGASGSGKSTLLRCIAGLDQADQGSIKLNGRMGMIFQQFHLFPHMTVLQNLTFAPQKVLGLSKIEAENRAYDLLNKVGLADKAQVYPNTLSGGQKQRIAIARALAMQPDILLFDEPTSALDPKMTQEILQIMRDLAHTGITMLVVTHEVAFLEQVADRIIQIKNGCVFNDTTAKEFFNSSWDF